VLRVGDKPEDEKPAATLPVDATSPKPASFEYSITYPKSPYEIEVEKKAAAADAPPADKGEKSVSLVKLLGLAAGGVLIGFLIVLGINAWPTRSSPDIKSPAAAAAPTAQAPQLDRTNAPAVEAWLRGGGQLVIDNLASDYHRVAAATAANDVQGLVPACAALRTSAETAQAYPSIPDQEAQVHWSASLAQSARAGTDCLAGVTANYLELVTQAGHEAGASSRESALMNARIETLRGN
jgi:hypothetical protein